MKTEESRERRASRATAGILAILFVLVPAANVLWGDPSSVRSPARLDPNESPFPILRMGPELSVVSVDPSANLSTRLLLASLQGLVNRVQVEVYLDTARVAGNTTEMLSFLAARYGVVSTPITTAEALDAFAPRAEGLVVYDPSRPESINVATMIAANRSAALVGPDLAPVLNATYGLPILFDYRDPAGGWSSLDAVAATDRALRELYPGSSRTLLAILPPDRWAIRDYLVATRAFVFYVPQGALASPFEAAATRRVLDAAPHGIPILGWFDSPTLTEENAFVQMASRAGKAIVGVQDVPNLSVLTALGRNETRVQTTAASTLPLENRTYAVLAVPDGDNVDFVAGRMRELWTSPERGTVPIAWSMNPLLADLAPPLLDSYYDTMTPVDRFVAAPSGAGYLYPDYTGPGDLPPYLEASARYATATDMDVGWLLNAFAASEIPYSDASLSAYVDALRPEGLVLDYDDQPKSRDAWMQRGSAAVAPVVRSTHFWTTRENFLGKFEAARAAWDEGPHFLWITIYTFRYDLRDAVALVDEMQRRTRDDVVLVTPSQFFRLMREDFLARAEVRVRAAGGPIASTVLASILASARAHVSEAQALRTAGDLNGAAHEAYLALEDLRTVESVEALLAIGLLIALLAAAAVTVRRPNARSSPRVTSRLRSSVFVIAAVGFFFLALREAVLQNFWTYPAIFVGVVVAGASRPLARHIERIYPSRGSVAAALFLLLAASLAIRTTVAFPLAIVAVHAALGSVLRREPLPSAELTVAFAVGCAIGFAAPFALPVMTALAVLLVGAPSTMPFDLRPTPEPVRVAGRGFAGLLLVLPLAALAIPTSYAMSLLLQLQGEALTWIAAVLLAGSALAAGCVDRLLPARDATRSTIAALALAVALCGVVLLARGTVVASLSLAALFAALAFAAIGAVRVHVERGGASHDVLVPAISLVPLLLLFVRMPPIVYSLTLVPLPEPVEVALYTPVILVAAAAVILGAFAWIRGRRAAGVEKDYPAEANGGAGGT